MKINVGALFHVKDRSGASEAVIKHELGYFVAVATCSFHMFLMRPLRNGINLAAHVGCLRIEAESDCELVIDAVKDTYRFNGSQAATIIECIQLSCDIG